ADEAPPDVGGDLGGLGVEGVHGQLAGAGLVQLFDDVDHRRRVARRGEVGDQSPVDVGDLYVVGGGHGGRLDLAPAVLQDGRRTAPAVGDGSGTAEYPIGRGRTEEQPRLVEVVDLARCRGENLRS